jgi:hypothetical protein
MIKWRIVNDPELWCPVLDYRGGVIGATPRHFESSGINNELTVHLTRDSLVHYVYGGLNYNFSEDDSKYAEGLSPCDWDKTFGGDYKKLNTLYINKSVVLTTNKLFSLVSYERYVSDIEKTLLIDNVTSSHPNIIDASQVEVSGAGLYVKPFIGTTNQTGVATLTFRYQGSVTGTLKIRVVKYPYVLNNLPEALPSGPIRIPYGTTYNINDIFSNIAASDSISLYPITLTSSNPTILDVQSKPPKLNTAAYADTYIQWGEILSKMPGSPVLANCDWVFSGSSVGTANLIARKGNDFNHLYTEKVVPYQVIKADPKVSFSIEDGGGGTYFAPWPIQRNIFKNESPLNNFIYSSSNPEKISLSEDGTFYINPNTSTGNVTLTISTTGNNNYNGWTGVKIITLSRASLNQYNSTFKYPKSNLSGSVVGNNSFEFATGSANFSFGSSLKYQSATGIVNAPLIYTSSNPAVATINSTGLATFLNTGVTIIKTIFTGNNQFNATEYSFQLVLNKIAIIITEPNQYFYKNVTSEPFQLNPVIGIDSNYYKYHPDTNLSLINNNLLYRSLNTNVATVNLDGLVNIVGAGSTNIEIYKEETPEVNRASLNIPIKVSKNKAVITVPSNSYTKLVSDDLFYLNAYSNNNNVPLTYTNSDPSVINVDSYGRVSIIGAGTANVVISQASNNNWDAAVNKTVNIVVNKLSSILDFPLIPSKLTTSPPFNLSVTSNNDQPIYYKSNNSSLATVDSFGLLTILKSGQATIEASQIGNDVWSPVSKTQNLIVGFSTDPTAPSGPRFILGEKIIISNNNSYNGAYRITGVTSDGKYYFECWPDCSPITYIGEELVGSNPFSNFGQSLYINNDGNILVVGAAKENFESEVGPKKNVGFAYIYNRYNNNNNNWYLAKRISGRNLKSFGEFGKSVAIDNGNCVAVGEPFFRNPNQEFLPFDRGYGAVHLFTGQKANLDWDWDRSLYGSSIAGSEFGYSIDLNNSGDVLVVGAPKEVTNNITGGAVYVYCKLANGWKLDGKITGSLNNERFGHSVKINSGNRIAVKATNNAHIYDYTGNLLTLSRSIPTPQYGDILPTNFNKTIDINLSGNRLLVGSPNTGYGLARLFAKGANNTFWYTITTFTGQSGYFNYGASVGLDTKSNRILIGAPDENMVYIYTGASFAFHKKIGYNEFNSKDLSRCVSPFSGIGNCVAINEDSNYFAFGAYLSGPNAEGSVLVTGEIV